MDSLNCGSSMGSWVYSSDWTNVSVLFSSMAPAPRSQWSDSVTFNVRCANADRAPRGPEEDERLHPRDAEGQILARVRKGEHQPGQRHVRVRAVQEEPEGRVGGAA